MPSRTGIHTVSAYINRKDESPHNQGFALITALGLMTIVMLLSLTMLSLTRLETKSTRSRLELHLARKQSYFALKEAIKELQIHAGPDNRVTAIAEIAGKASNNNGCRYRTDVWDSITGERTFSCLISKEMTERKTLTDQIPTPETVPLLKPDIAESFNSFRVTKAKTYPKLISESQTDNILPKNETPQIRQVLLLKGDTTGNSIFADTIESSIDSSLAPKRSFAWWISDNGTKANITTVDRCNSIISSDYDQDKVKLKQIRENVKHMIGHYQSIEDDFQDKTPFVQSNQSSVDDLKKITSFGDLYNIRTINSSQTYRRRIKSRYHDYTVNSLFTLTNTLDGKLRQDLSHLKRVPADITQQELDIIYNKPQWDYITPRIRDMINYSHESPEDTINIKIPETHSTDPVKFALHPIIPELIIAASVYCHSSTNELYLYYYIFADVWNPYAKSMKFKNRKLSNTSALVDPSKNTSDINIRVTGLPEITLRNHSSKIISGPFELPDIFQCINPNETHPPGYMQPYSAPSSQHDGAHSGRGVIASHIESIGYNAHTSDEFTVNFSESDMTITIETEVAPDEFRVTQQIDLKNIAEFSIDYKNQLGGPRYHDRFVTGYSMAKRTKINANNWSFGFHGKFVDEWNSESDSLETLFTHFDMRRSNINIDMNTPTLGDGIFYDVRNIHDLDRSQMMTNMDFFRSGGTYWQPPYRMARLFDVPNQEPISIGYLNHLAIEDLPTYAVGNDPDTNNNNIIDFREHDGGVNVFFDRYFFSTIPIEAKSWNKRDTLPNTKIIHAASYNGIDNTGNASSAKNLMIRNGFNINSISEYAWKAVLSAINIPKFPYTQHSAYDKFFKQSESGTTKATLKNLKNAFFKFPFHAGEYLDAPNAPKKDQYHYISPEDASTFSKDIISRANHETFLQGFRELTSEQTDELAKAIVEHIKKWSFAHGRPFKSISEFLNAGILRKSIDSVPTINTPKDGIKKIPTNSPAYISQAMLMNTLAPYLFARSDTFTVRAYGDIKSSSNIKASAYCEAVVQRTPEEISPRLGRKFKITSFRWLSPDDI